MIVARGTPEHPELRSEPWVRVIRQETEQQNERWKRRHYTVDFVHRAFLPAYVAEHALPFAEQLAGRMVSTRT